MNRFLNVVLIASLVFTLAACGGGAGNTPTPANSTSAISQGQAGKYIVVLKPGESISSVNSLAAGLANRPIHSYEHALVGFSGILSPSEYASLSKDPRVSYIEPDQMVSIVKGPPGGSPPGGGGGGGGGGGTPPPQEVPWGVHRIGADSNSNTGAGIGVAVIDTGVDLTHPDLAGVVDGDNEVKPGDPANDDNGHGTHVSGTIAAVDNTIGYVGVAPDATIIAVKVLDRHGSGWVSDINAGIDWVAANKDAYNIKVANMSLGGGGYIQSMHDAILAATNVGITFVVAAGNSSAYAGNYSPAAYDDCVITVTALNPDDTFAYYSNWGEPPVDLIAPGTNVPSLWKNGGYNTISGTSMASPHVAGSAALFIASYFTTNGSYPSFTQVRDGLVAAGESGAWSGDPDGSYEKLVDASSL